MTATLENVAAIIVTVTVDATGASFVAATFLGRGIGSRIIRLAFFSFLFLVITSFLVGWEAAEGVLSIVVGSHDGCDSSSSVASTSLENL